MDVSKEIEMTCHDYPSTTRCVEKTTHGQPLRLPTPKAKRMKVTCHTVIPAGLIWVINRWTKNRGILPPQNGWFIMENPIKWMIWGVPLFLETPKYEIPETSKVWPLAERAVVALISRHFSTCWSDGNVQPWHGMNHEILIGSGSGILLLAYEPIPK